MSPADSCAHVLLILRRLVAIVGERPAGKLMTHCCVLVFAVVTVVFVVVSVLLLFVVVPVVFVVVLVVRLFAVFTVVETKGMK